MELGAIIERIGRQAAIGAIWLIRACIRWYRSRQVTYYMPVAPEMRELSEEEREGAPKMQEMRIEMRED
jgi:hypothetical protein